MQKLTSTAIDVQNKVQETLHTSFAFTNATNNEIMKNVAVWHRTDNGLFYYVPVAFGCNRITLLHWE